MRVVSWNVLADAYVRREYYPQTPVSTLDPAARRAAVVERLAGYAETDVVCLQEADTALVDLAAARLTGFAARLLERHRRAEGCAIFVRSAFAADPVFEELRFADRSGHVALAATCHGLTIVTAHLKWEPDGTPSGSHRGRAQLAELLDRWPAGARIVCGDFNADPDSVVLALARERGLRDAYASLPHAYTCNANRVKKRIDFILCSEGLVATPVPLGLEVADDTPLPGGGEPSDHLAIEARVRRVG